MHTGTDDGGGNIHKAKLNGNGTFSVGKTWPVSELTGIEVITVRILNLALPIPHFMLKLSTVHHLGHLIRKNVQMAERQRKRPICIRHCPGPAIP
jgi:hypothetical protein